MPEECWINVYRDRSHRYAEYRIAWFEGHIKRPYSPLLYRIHVKLKRQYIRPKELVQGPVMDWMG